MATETVKLYGGNADGRWHKVPRGAIVTECRGSWYAKTDGVWREADPTTPNETTPATDTSEVESSTTASTNTKPAPRKRRKTTG